MRLVIDGKGQLWQIDKWGHYVVYHGPAPADAVVIQADFHDGFTATSEQYETAFGTRSYNMRVSSQTTTYELTVTELKTLMAKELNVGEDKITIRFLTRSVGDDRFCTPSQETYALEVIVSGNKPSAPIDESVQFISGQPR